MNCILLTPLKTKQITKKPQQNKPKPKNEHKIPTKPRQKGKKTQTKKQTTTPKQKKQITKTNPVHWVGEPRTMKIRGRGPDFILKEHVTGAGTEEEVQKSGFLFGLRRTRNCEGH